MATHPSHECSGPRRRGAGDGAPPTTSGVDATSAMDVLKLLDQTAKRWPISIDPVAAGPKLSAGNNAEIMLRDIVVMLLVNRGGSDAVGGLYVLLDTAEGITGTPVDRDLRAKLLLAYSKLKQHRQSIWLGVGRRRSNGW